MFYKAAFCIAAGLFYSSAVLAMEAVSQSDSAVTKGMMKSADDNYVDYGAGNSENNANLSAEFEIADIPPVLVTAEEIEPAADPMEGFNRSMFEFNETVDEVFLEPVAKGYRAILPEYGRARVGDFIGNLATPVSFANSLLQGDLNNAMTSFWRFFINTTLGIGGLFDQATEWGIEKREEDFGQTLGSYGIGAGPYIVWPFLGPSSARDTVGMIADILVTPTTYVSLPASIGYKGSDIVHTRSELIEVIDGIRAESFDPYSTVKSAYDQRRSKQVENFKEVAR